MIKLLHGDCLELMKDIPDKSVDFCLADPPYGVTACAWDKIIPFEHMWEQLKRIIKDNGAIALFGSEPFSSRLRLSNIKMFKYDWIWKKNKHSNFLNCSKEPRRIFEIISIFYNKLGKYNPILIKLSEASMKRNKRNRFKERTSPSEGQYNRAILMYKDYKNIEYGWPKNIIEFKLEANNQFKKHVFHPTQKPVALLEYLIKTYTLENETVLDFCMGSGSTGIACLNLNRNFIGIEKDEKYFEIAKQRIENHKPQLTLIDNHILQEKIKEGER